MERVVKTATHIDQGWHIQGCLDDGNSDSHDMIQAALKLLGSQASFSLYRDIVLYNILYTVYPIQFQHLILHIHIL